MRKIVVLLLVFVSLPLFGQTKTGTLKIFSEIPGIVVYLDENKQSADIQEIKDVPIGSHYLKVLSGGAIVYSEVIEIKENAITTILIKNKGQVPTEVNTPEKVNQQNSDNKTQGNTANGKPGTLKIFSELTGIIVYLDENKQGTDIKQISDIPAGSHYLKVLLNNVSVYGEVVEIKENAVTTVLIKNTGQVQEKILESKTAEQQTYNNSKLDIILSKGMSTTTKGYSNLYPGYYGYWGTSNSVATSVETIDWKIIQGGVKEINESTFANLTENTGLQATIAKQWKNYSKTIGITAAIAIPTLIVETWMLADIVGKKNTFPIMKGNTNGQATLFAVLAVPCIISTMICLKLPEPHGHNISVDDAAKESQKYNKKLKIKLGLPESYDMNR